MSLLGCFRRECLAMERLHSVAEEGAQGDTPDAALVCSSSEVVSESVGSVLEKVLRRKKKASWRVYEMKLFLVHHKQWDKGKKEALVER